MSTAAHNPSATNAAPERLQLGERRSPEHAHTSAPLTRQVRRAARLLYLVQGAQHMPRQRQPALQGGESDMSRCHVNNAAVKCAPAVHYVRGPTAMFTCECNQSSI